MGKHQKWRIKKIQVLHLRLKKMRVNNKNGGLTNNKKLHITNLKKKILASTKNGGLRNTSYRLKIYLKKIDQTTKMAD